MVNRFPLNFFLCRKSVFHYLDVAKVQNNFAFCKFFPKNFLDFLNDNVKSFLPFVLCSRGEWRWERYGRDEGRDDGRDKTIGNPLFKGLPTVRWERWRTLRNKWQLLSNKVPLFFNNCHLLNSM